MHVPPNPSAEMNDDLDPERLDYLVPPVASMGVDPFEFCSLGRSVKGGYVWHGRTLTERVIHFMDQYKHSAA